VQQTHRARALGAGTGAAGRGETAHFHAARPPSHPPPWLSRSRVASSPFRRSTRTPTDRARRWEWRICPGGRAAQPHRGPLAGRRRAIDASQPVKSSRRQSARQIISAPVSHANHLDASQPVKSSRRQSATQIIAGRPVGHPNDDGASQPRKSSQAGQSVAQMMTAHGRRGE
jgi:hypothetical protein